MNSQQIANLFVDQGVLDASQTEEFPGSAGASPAVSCAPRDTLAATIIGSASRSSAAVFRAARKTTGEAPALPNE